MTATDERAARVLRLSELDLRHLLQLLQGYGMDLRMLALHEDIPGSYWGGSEAGLRGSTLFVRPDTPLHSALHEACHYICMSPERRAMLETDAGGDHPEENAVCYLQILLASALPGAGRERMLTDMDDWGYTFRLGSAKRWFESDAEDARQWLLAHGLIDGSSRSSGQLRQS